MSPSNPDLPLINTVEREFVAASTDGTYEDARKRIHKEIAYELVGYLNTCCYKEVVIEIASRQNIPPDPNVVLNSKQQVLADAIGIPSWQRGKPAGVRMRVLFYLYGYEDGKCHLEDR